VRDVGRRDELPQVSEARGLLLQIRSRGEQRLQRRREVRVARELVGNRRLSGPRARVVRRCIRLRRLGRFSRVRRTAGTVGLARGRRTSSRRGPADAGGRAMAGRCAATLRMQIDDAAEHSEADRRRESCNRINKTVHWSLPSAFARGFGGQVLDGSKLPGGTRFQLPCQRLIR